jgi:hypothetical protein
MASKQTALPKDVLSAIEGRIRLIGDSRADTMRRIVRDENIVIAWNELSAARKGKAGPFPEELISILYRAVYEAGWILQWQEMMTRGEARKIAEGLELLAKREPHLFLTPNPTRLGDPAGVRREARLSNPRSLLFLLEKYRMHAQEIPTGARRRPEARSLARRISSIFRKAVGKPCHEATAALIRAAHGGECDAETVRTYVSKGGPKRK